MKKCSYCGKEYPDTATVCDIDAHPLLDPNPPAPSRSEYQRLPGRGTQVEGGGWLAISGSLCTMWMARDHLLLVARTGYTETYKRFYFRDIQAVIIRQTPTAFLWNILLGIVALCFFLAALLTPPAGVIARIVCSWIGGLFVFLVLLNLWLGSTCVTQIKTAVQTEELAAWNRMRAARKGLAMIRPRLLEAQGEFPQAQLKARLEAQILRQNQSSAPETS
jgi:hypothetical protein